MNVINILERALEGVIEGDLRASDLPYILETVQWGYAFEEVTQNKITPIESVLPINAAACSEIGEVILEPTVAEGAAVDLMVNRNTDFTLEPEDDWL
jgi:hypothetical protein